MTRASRLCYIRAAGYARIRRLQWCVYWVFRCSVEFSLPRRANHSCRESTGPRKVTHARSAKISGWHIVPHSVPHPAVCAAEHSVDPSPYRASPESSVLPHLTATLPQATKDRD